MHEKLEEAVMKLLQTFYPKAEDYVLTEGIDDTTSFIIQVMGPPENIPTP